MAQRARRYRLMGRTPNFGILVMLGKHGRGLYIHIHGYLKGKRHRNRNRWFSGVMNFTELDKLIAELTRQLHGAVNDCENYRVVCRCAGFAIEVLGQPYGDGFYNLAIAVPGVHLYLFGLKNRSMRMLLWALRRERGFAVQAYLTHLHLVPPVHDIRSPSVLPYAPV